MIINMLELSTAHINSRTVESFNEKYYFGLIVYDKPKYGWFIHVPEEEFLSEMELPSDLERLIKLAILKDCVWIMLDSDADIICEIPHFVW